MNFIKEFFERITDLGSLVAMGVVGLFFLLTSFDIFIRLFLTIAISFGIIATIRVNYYKHRPFKKKKPKNVLGIVAESSFPSMHSSNVFGFAFSVGLSTNYKLFIFFVFIALLVVFSRWYLRKHYPVDLIAGSILGALVGFAVYLIT